MSAAPTDAITARLERCYASAVHDVMKDMGYTDFVLPHDLRPMFPEQRLCGPVFTMSGHVDSSADKHSTLMGWTGFLSTAPAGHVVVCQPNDQRVAHMGELSAQALQLRGVRGYIVDGGCRDVDLMLGIGFQVFCRYYTPQDVTSYWMPDGYDVPVTIGEVEVHPGDYVLGDRDGVCVIPKADAEKIVTATEKAVSTENTMREAILGGMDPQAAYMKYGKF